MGRSRPRAGRRLPVITNGILSVVLLLLLPAGRVEQAAPAEDEYYFAIEINGTLCGYSRFVTSPLFQGGKELLQLKHESLTRVAALGGRAESRLYLTYHIDPLTGRFTYHDSTIEQGSMRLTSKIRIEGAQAFVSGSGMNQEHVVPLPPDVVLGNTLYYPHLLADFVMRKLETRTYLIFDGRDAQVQETTYTKVGAEKLRRAGKTYETVILDSLNKWNGMRSKLWLDTGTGIVVQAQHPSRLSYVADASVVQSLQRANLDTNLLAAVNISIPNAKEISYMRVRAALAPTGLWLSPEALNVRGQSFKGTIKDNLLEGEFEIEHLRYNGLKAPPFPPDFRGDLSLKDHLTATELIQADDSVLAEKAEEITKGSKDSWDAVCRLSRWVGENIEGAIPGGGSARGTYDTRSGECGGHSFLLAAFSRAVGIPARVVWGCLYLPSGGGVFGQHAWNEVYMGEAGWIPVDSTIREDDYVDSGHIRIGVHQSTTIGLNARKMEILDYRIGSKHPSEARPLNATTYEKYLGEYTHSSKGRVQVLVQDGALVLDIPGKVSLALKEPDEKGFWQSKLTDRVYVSFQAAEPGKITEVHLHEILPLRRTGPLDAPVADVPADYRRYPGRYLLLQTQAEFLVQYEEGTLLLHNLAAKRITRLKPSGDEGRWQDESGNLSIRFVLDEKGEVGSLTVESISRFRR